MVKILKIEIGKKPEVVEIENKLENYQEIVGGYIEVPFISKKLNDLRIDLICNDEGVIRKLPPSLVLKVDEAPTVVIGTDGIIHGNCLFVSHNLEGDFVGLNDEQINYLLEMLSFNDYQIVVDGKVKSITSLRVE